MALSPSVTHALPAVTLSSREAAKLKDPLSQSSAKREDSTPAPQPNVDRELTELLNDDIRQKYYKGAKQSSLVLCRPFPHLHGIND